MKRCLAFAFGALALGWPAGVTRGGDAPFPTAPAQSLYAPPSNDLVPPAPDPHPAPPNPAPLLPPVETFGGPSLYGSGPPGHFTAGVGIDLLEPHIQHDPAFGTQVSGITGSFSRVDTYFNQDFTVAPRVWLGYVNDCGLGVRGSWSHVNETAHASTVNNDFTGATTVFSDNPFFGVVDQITALGPGDVLSFSYKIQLDVWDLEATQDFQIGKWYLLAATGVRISRLEQDYGALAVDTLTGLTGATGSSGNRFTGGGPTLALEVRRPLWGNDFALFGSARGAILFGDADRNAHKERMVLGVPVQEENYQTSEDDLQSVFEIELGVEWCKDLGRARALAQLALVGQEWVGAGSATSQDGNLGFVGLTLTAGLNF